MQYLKAAFVSVLLLLLAFPCMAQVSKGSISGTIVDSGNAVVLGAQIKARNNETGAVFSTNSRDNGLFQLTPLPTGTYTLEITKEGFKLAQYKDVVVSADAVNNLGIVHISPGQVIDDVFEPGGGDPLVDVVEVAAVTKVDGDTLRFFPGIQEKEGLDALGLFVPGIAPSRDNNFSNTNGGTGLSTNGLRGRNNDQQIDGQNNNDNSVAGPSLFLADPNFVSQYVAIASNAQPAYGRNSGSVINIVTKSGSNAWHGAIYGSENNSVLNSLSSDDKRFQNLKKVPRLNDEFTGFTVGGPLVKSKLFFFGGFDEEIVSTQNIFHSDLLTPTPKGLLQLAGCFPGSQSIQALAKFGPYGISGGNPTPTNPLNLNVGACTNVQFGGVTRILPNPVHSFNWIAKADWQLGNDNISARYIFNRDNFFNQNDNGAAGYVFNTPALNQGVLLSWTHPFTGKMVNEARLSFGRSNVEFGGNSIGNTDPKVGQFDQALANVTFQAPGFLGFGPRENLPQGRIMNIWQAQDNWSYALGKHLLKAGINFTYQRTPDVFLPTINGAFRFANFTSFANDVPNRIRAAQGPSSLDFREYDTFVYVGDDWKITQDLTLSMGLTYSYFGQPANLFNDITTKRESNPATAFWNPALPLNIRTYPKTDTYTTAFAPNVGFAYSPKWGGWLTGNDKTVIRGGYRLTYDPAFYNIYLNIANSAPDVILQSLVGAGAAVHPLPANPTGPVVRSQLAPFLSLGTRDPRTFNQTNTPTNFSPDRVQSYSLGIQREITRNSAFEARYVGNKADSLFQSINGNPFIADLKASFPNLVPAGLTPCPTTQQIGPGAGTDVGRVNCGTGILRSRTNTGYSHYNGLQLEFRANNLFKQLTVRSAYTWAKTLDNVSEIFSTFAAGNTNAFAQNPLNFKRGEYGFSGLDYPGTWTLLFSEQLPFFKDQKGWAGHVLGGWGVSANYILESGQRYTPAEVFSAFATAAGNFYDVGFFGTFAGIDTARPFMGNLNAPTTSVGMFARDACNLFSLTGFDPLCNGNPNQLISLTAVGKSGCETNPTVPCPFVAVTKNDVRFIVNSGQAQTLFGTPFGNSGRNVAQDAITNIANVEIFKKIKLSERVAFEVHATMLNAFNHANFSSIDPFLEDAGLSQQGRGFGDPTLTNAPGRKIFIGGRISF
jgi:hypothetical protein